MLKSIKIQNFKAIKEPALELNNLASVNYLVGKNGSGKSSVLENIALLNDSNFDNQNKEIEVDIRNFKPGYYLWTLGHIDNTGIEMSLPGNGYQPFKDLTDNEKQIFKRELDFFVKMCIYDYTQGLSISLKRGHESSSSKIRRDLPCRDLGVYYDLPWSAEKVTLVISTYKEISLKKNF